MTAFFGGFRMQGGWRWLHAALLGVVLRLEGNTVMLVGVLTTVGLISHESRCRIYTILKRKLLGFIQVHTRCCTGTGPARSDSWKSIAGPGIPHSFPQLTLMRPQLPTLRPFIVKRGWES